MRPPNSISALCAMTFGLLGAAFVVIGTLYGCLGVSIRGAASSWAFLPIGVVCLLIGLVCALAVRRRRRRERWVQSAGVAVPGTVIQVRHHVFIISDEIHFDLIMPGFQHVSLGTFPDKYLQNCAICTATLPLPTL